MQVSCFSCVRIFFNLDEAASLASFMLFIAMSWAALVKRLLDFFFGVASAGCSSSGASDEGAAMTLADPVSEGGLELGLSFRH